VSQIFWKDFVLDDNFGALLFFENVDQPESSRRVAGLCPPLPSALKNCSTEAARAGCTGTQEGTRAKIQETRTEQRPARMVGLFDLDSISAHVDMEVDRSISALRPNVRREEEA
jgi:hypothetical protein